MGVRMMTEVYLSKSGRVSSKVGRATGKVVQKGRVWARERASVLLLLWSRFTLTAHTTRAPGRYCRKSRGTSNPRYNLEKKKTKKKEQKNTAAVQVGGAGPLGTRFFRGGPGAAWLGGHWTNGLNG